MCLFNFGSFRLPYSWSVPARGEKETELSRYWAGLGPWRLFITAVPRLYCPLASEGEQRLRDSHQHQEKLHALVMPRQASTDGRLLWDQQGLGKKFCIWWGDPGFCRWAEDKNPGISRSTDQHRGSASWVPSKKEKKYAAVFSFSINNCTGGNTGVPIRLTLFVFSMVTNFQQLLPQAPWPSHPSST